MEVELKYSIDTHFMEELLFSIISEDKQSDVLARIYRTLDIARNIASDDLDWIVFDVAAFVRNISGHNMKIVEYLEKTFLNSDQIEKIMSIAEYSKFRSKCKTKEEKILYDSSRLSGLVAADMAKQLLKGSGDSEWDIRGQLDNIKSNFISQKCITEKGREKERVKIDFAQKFIKSLDITFNR